VLFTKTSARFHRSRLSALARLVGLRGLDGVFQNCLIDPGEFQAGVVEENAPWRSFPKLSTKQFLWVDWPSAKPKAGDTGTRKWWQEPKERQLPHCRRIAD